MPVELLVGAAVGAAASSPDVRKVVRRGVVYGVAGALIAYDTVSAFASGVVRGARQFTAANGCEAHGEGDAPCSAQQTAEKGAAPKTSDDASPPAATRLNSST